MIEVSVEYSLFFFPELDVVLDEIAGVDSDGSGAGFGGRDIQYSYDCAERAENVARKMAEVEGVTSVICGDKQIK